MTRVSRAPLPVRWLRRALLGCQLLGWFGFELLLANVAQARLILSPRLEVRPRWIEYRTRLQSRAARTLLGVMISLTPGTLTCDLEGDTLLIHALDAESEELAIRTIRESFENLLARMEAVG